MAEYKDWGSDAPVPFDADLIDLDVLPSLHRKRLSFRFDGANYDFARPEDLSALDQANLQRAFKRVWEIEHDPGDADGQITPQLQDTMARLDRRICEIAVYGEAGNEGQTMPAGERAELVARMLPVQRNVIRNSFFRGFDSLLPWVTELVRTELTAVLTSATTATPVEAEPSEPSIDVSAPPLTAASAKPKKSRQPSPSGTRAA